jgi:hypothetical protein
MITSTTKMVLLKGLLDRVSRAQAQGTTSKNYVAESRKIIEMSTYSETERPPVKVYLSK